VINQIEKKPREAAGRIEMTVLLSRRDCLKARLSAARARPSRAKPRFGGRASARLLRAEQAVLSFEGKGNHVFGLAFFRPEKYRSRTPIRQRADPRFGARIGR
jgi:hypothetical protein